MNALSAQDCRQLGSWLICAGPIMGIIDAFVSVPVWLHDTVGTIALLGLVLCVGAQLVIWRHRARRRRVHARR